MEWLFVIAIVVWTEDLPLPLWALLILSLVGITLVL